MYIVLVLKLLYIK